jgi:hypothetical protein
MYMKKKNCSFVVLVPLSFLFFLICVQSLFAGVRGTLMGNLETVVSNGPLDAGRNPALLATHTGDSAAALYLLYRVYEINRENVQASNMDYEVPRSTSADIIAGFSTHIGSSVLGISIDSNENGSQFETSEANITVHNTTTFILDSESRSTNPSLNTSIGIPFDGANSIGFQLRTGYSRKKDETEMTATNAGVPLEIINMESESKSLMFELGFGYLHRTDLSQIGLYFTSGILQFQQADYEYRAQYAGFAQTYSQNNYYKYSSGMTVSAGGFHQITSSLAVAFEAGYRFPLSYKYTQYKYVGGVEPGETQAVTESSNGVIIMNGGVSLALNSSLTVSTGVFYSRARKYKYESSTETNSEEKSMQQRFNVWLFTAGAEYTVNTNMIFSLGTIILRSKYNNDENSHNESGGSTIGAMDVEVTSWKFEVAAGMTYLF